MKFWNRKTKLRRHLSFKNRTLLVLEELAKKSDKDIGTIIDEIVQESFAFRNMLNELHDDYLDINLKT